MQKCRRTLKRYHEQVQDLIFQNMKAFILKQPRDFRGCFCVNLFPCLLRIENRVPFMYHEHDQIVWKGEKACADMVCKQQWNDRGRCDPDPDRGRHSL